MAIKLTKPISDKAASALTSTADKARAVNVSFTGQLAALQVGETATKTQRARTSKLAFDLDVEMTKLRNQMKGGINQQISRASKSTGNTYSFEFASVLTPSNKVYLVCIITRTA